MSNIKKSLGRSLFEIGIMLLVYISSWFVLTKLIGYPEKVGLLLGTVFAVALGALLRGMKVSEFGGVECIVALTLLLQVWNGQPALSINSKYAWTVALVAVPLATYVIGRTIRRPAIQSEQVHR